jgi:hypothetical protein
MQQRIFGKKNNKVTCWEHGASGVKASLRGKLDVSLQVASAGGRRILASIHEIADAGMASNNNGGLIFRRVI